MISEIFESKKGERVGARYTICEVHRELFDLLLIELKNDPELLRRVVRLLETAFVMGIKMNSRLIEKQISEEYGQNHNAKANAEMREKRKELVEILKRDQEFLKRYE